MTFEPWTIWVLGLPTVLILLSLRLHRSYRPAIPWHWVLLACFSGYFAEVIQTRSARLSLFSVYIATLLWILTHYRDPDEPFRRLKKKIASSMTRVQQQSFQRQQVEAFR